MGKRLAWITALVAIPTLLLLFFRDDPLDPAPDLQPRHPLLSDHSTNGFVQLTDKWSSYPAIETAQLNPALDMMSGARPWDQAAADASDKTHPDYAADLEQALAKKDWQLRSGLPEGEVDTKATLPFYRNGRVANLRAVSLFRQNQSQEAWRLWDSVLRAAQRSVEGSTCTVDAFISLGLLRMCAQPALDAASLPPEQVDDAMLAKLQSRLLSVELTAETLSEISRHELQWWLGALRKLKQQGTDPTVRNMFPDKAENKKFARFFLKPNRTIHLSQAALRRAEPLLMRPAASPSEAWPPQVLAGVFPEAGRLEWLNPNRTGLAMLRESQQDYWIADKAFRATLALFRSTAVGVALRRWQRSHSGALPENLTELVPDFLDAVPQDPFDGKPLRWDQGKTTVYSIGSDWKDTAPDSRAFSPDKKRPSGRFAQDPESPGVRLDVPPSP